MGGHRFAVAAIVATLAGAALFAPSAAAAPCRGALGVPTAKTATQAGKAMRCLINRERARRGLARLDTSSRLGRAAKRHSRDMVRREYFDHVSPRGGTLLDRVRAAGYLGRARGYSIGENIAWGSDGLATPASIHRSLMRSRGHRANILRRSYRDVGIGIARGVPDDDAGRGATWTIAFGSRR